MPTVEARTSTADVLEKSPVARYIQLASLFRKRIEAGEWSVGDQIPTVEMLSRQCGVAGMTIRLALNQLEEEGLIQRYRAKGTFVRKRPERDLWCEVKTDWNGLLMSRADAQITVLSDRLGAVLDQTLFEHGQVAPSYRHLQRLHKRDGLPFLFADVFVDERICPLIPEENYTSKTAMRLVAELPGVRIVDARQVLSIDVADMETADLLALQLSAPVAKVQRLAIDADNTLILVANGIYRGDKVRIDMQLLS